MTEAKQMKKFEDYLAEAENVIKQLESGELPLEEAVDLYTKGIEALKNCYEILSKMEKRIEVVSKEGMTIKVKPFQ